MCESVNLRHKKCVSVAVEQNDDVDGEMLFSQAKGQLDVAYCYICLSCV